MVYILHLDSNKPYLLRYFVINEDEPKVNVEDFPFITKNVLKMIKTNLEETAKEKKDILLLNIYPADMPPITNGFLL